MIHAFSPYYLQCIPIIIHAVSALLCPPMGWYMLTLRASMILHGHWNYHTIAPVHFNQPFAIWVHELSNPREMFSRIVLRLLVTNSVEGELYLIQFSINYNGSTPVYFIHTTLYDDYHSWLTRMNPVWIARTIWDWRRTKEAIWPEANDRLPWLRSGLD